MVSLPSWIPWFKKGPKLERIVYINDYKKHKSHGHCSNKVTTTKYSLLTFVPVNLFQQFSRAANIYFLICVLFQTFTSWAPGGRIGTIIPLFFVTVFQMIKDAYEDIKRALADRAVNNSLATVMRVGKWEGWRQIRWKNVKTGDIVRVVQDQFVPADMVALASSLPAGLLYVETSQLDGETNLKPRRSLAETNHLTPESSAEWSNLRGTLTCEQPNADLHNFDGNLSLEGMGDKLIPISNDNILYRGVVIKNTSWVVGVVAFTGRETKLMKNLKNPPHKRSQVDSTTDKLVLLLFVLMAVLCLVGAIAHVVWTSQQLSSYWMIPAADSSSSAGLFFIDLIVFMLLYNSLVPISMYVTMDFVKLCQGKMILEQDLQIYDAATDTPAQAKTSSLNDELGLVEFVFSDKTGTLTQNKMEFVKFTVDNEEYGTDWKPGQEEEVARRCAPFTRFCDDRIQRGAWQAQPNAERIGKFLKLLALCHTIVPEMDQDSPMGVRYLAASPDEAALTEAARQLGIAFIQREHDGLIISIGGQHLRYQLLAVNEFNSDRKRMSVVLRDPSGRLMVLCKGADATVLPLLGENGKTHVENTKLALSRFSTDGLRTLVCAMAELSEEQYQDWYKNYFYPASVALKDKKRLLAEAAEKIEQNLELIGTTAIEDRLQDGVPDTIDMLRKANIKIWVLTGDKQETAINIGMSSSLLHKESNLFIINETERQAIRQQLLAEYARALEQPHNQHLFALVIDGESLEAILQTQRKKLAKIYEKAKNDPEELERIKARYGDKLAQVIAYTEEKNQKGEETLEALFLKLCLLCHSVICCRVTPLQKSEVVRLVKKKLPKAVTLAIGDGANDVSMIQAAHIGVGISGQEGLQAARAADYSFAQFRFLQRLLLIHGRYNYRRMSKLVLYCFYKNAVIQICNFFFFFYNAYSGKQLQENFAINTYNLLYTALPIGVLGVLDRDVSEYRVFEFPELYTDGQRRRFLNIRTFLQWMLVAVYHSVIIYFFSMAALQDTSIFAGTLGLGTMDFMQVAQFVFTATVIVVNLKVGFEMSEWTGFFHLCLWGSILLWTFFFLMDNIFFFVIDWLPLGSASSSSGDWLYSMIVIIIKETCWESLGTFFELHAMPGYYVLLTLIVGTCMIWQVTTKIIPRIWDPKLRHLLQEEDRPISKLLKRNQELSQEDKQRRLAEHARHLLEEERPFEDVRKFRRTTVAVIEGTRKIAQERLKHGSIFHSSSSLELQDMPVRDLAAVTPVPAEPDPADLRYEDMPSPQATPSKKKQSIVRKNTSSKSNADEDSLV